MNFKDRLRQIDSLHNKNRAKTNDQPKLPEAIKSTSTNTPFVKGHDCFDFNYNPDYRHGNILIHDYFGKKNSSVKLFLKEPPAYKISLKKTLFLDTETTGLSGGAGTCAFLVGVGFLNEDDNTFTLRQFFMNDFDEEHTMLNEISDFARKFDLLVTYNGKSYDIPLLNSRFIFNGIPSPFSEINHLDVLHSVRRLWNHRLPDCSLLSSEKYILRKTREGDIPGFMIPYVFFEYLKNKDKEPLKPVLYHNREDILTMVAILSEMVDVIEAPITKNVDSQGILRIGRFYENNSQYQQAIKLYDDFLKLSNEDISFRKDVIIQLALVYKKIHHYELAHKTWQKYLEKAAFHPLPYIELAKHHEHRKKDYAAAIKLVSQALKEMDIIFTLGRSTHWQEYREDLRHRFQRLKNKTSR